MMKSECGERHGSRVLRSCNGGSSPGGMRDWLGDSQLGTAAMARGGDSTREVQCLNFQGENPWSGLNWLCLTIALVKALFL